MIICRGRVGERKFFVRVDVSFIPFLCHPLHRAYTAQLRTEQMGHSICFYFSESGEKVVFKTGLLSCLNILELYNKHITPLVPPDPVELEAKAKELEEKKKNRRKKIKIKEGRKKRRVFL